MTDRKSQLKLTLLSGMFTVVATVGGAIITVGFPILFQGKDTSALPGELSPGGLPSVSLDPESGETGDDQNLGEFEVNSQPTENQPTGRRPDRSPDPEEGASNSDKPSLPITFTLRHGEHHTALKGKVSVSIQFTEVDGEGLVTVVVGLPQGESKRFPFAYGGDQRSFELDRETRHITLLWIDWDTHSVALTIT